MEMRLVFLRTLALLCALVGSGLVGPAAGWTAEPYQVMVVSSYSPAFHWAQEINQGIEAILNERARLHFFYLQTKRDLENGPERAEQIYQKFLELQPDGVIAADDNAQTLFVKPYLADRVTTPVIFCGVNADPVAYGYPAGNVSGVSERIHYAEILALSRQLDPSIRSFAFMARRSPSTDLIIQQLRHELAAGELSLPNVAVLRPRTVREAVDMARSWRSQTDLLVFDTLEGLLDDQGRALKDAQAMPPVIQAFGKMTGSTNMQGVYYGALSGVVKSGFEQGEKAARMLLKALQGTPLEELLIQRNYRGIRLINVTTLKQLGLIPSPMVLRGAELVRSNLEAVRE